MKNALTVFTTPADLGSFAIRVIEIAGQPWFVAADVCRALGLRNPTMTLRSLAPDERTLRNFEGGPAAGVNLISESGLYKLILRAHPDRVPAVRRFQDWVTREVLPAIRKDGMYVMARRRCALARCPMTR
jgi:prophage antirepressor-like protein